MADIELPPLNQIGRAADSPERGVHLAVGFSLSAPIAVPATAYSGCPWIRIQTACIIA